jgi:hypothetical protein
MKSVGMLQAYGEYKRFVALSKKFVKERGISLNKKKIAGGGYVKNWGININGKVKRRRKQKSQPGQ